MQNFRKFLNLNFENKVYQAFCPIWDNKVQFGGQRVYLKYLILSPLSTYSALSLCKLSKKSLGGFQEKCPPYWEQKMFLKC